MKAETPDDLSHYHLDAAPENYLELWKWFSEDAAKIKDKMWTMAAFFYTLLGALLSFMAKAVVGTSPLQLKRPAVVLLASLIGLLLSGYGMYMLWEYGKHLQTGWQRTDYLRTKIKGLPPIWYAGDIEKIVQETTDLANPEIKKHPKIPKIAQRLIGLLGLYFLAFLGVLLVIVFYVY